MKGGLKLDEQKKTSKNILPRIIALIAAVIIIVYLIYNTVRLITSPADTFVVENGTLDSAETVDAVVIRDEQVLQGNNYMNGMEKVVSEGKRAAKGEAIFRYYVNGEDTIKKEIEDLDNKIAEAQKSENSIYPTDVQVLKNKIKALEEKIYETNNIEEVENYKKEIEECTLKISTIIGDLSPVGSYLKDLINQKNAYLKKITDGAEEIKTTESGTVSYRVDNLESILTAADFGYLNKQFLDDLNLKSGELIESSNVITQFYCYLAIEMNSDSAMNAKVGDKVKIRYDVDSSITSEIVQINEEEDSRVIIFKIKDLPEKMINYRKISVDVIWWEYSGLKIPNSAIITEGDKSFVERNRAGYNAKVLVKILKQNDSYAIVDNYTTQELQELGYSYDEINNMYSIKQYDKIIVNSKK